MSANIDKIRELHELEQLEREQWYRRCRQDFTAFAIEALSAQNLSPAKHHRVICAHLDALARGKFDRLMILAPPGSAKTTFTSRLFPAWAFANRPGINIIGSSHTASLAEENSGQTQRIIRELPDLLGYGLANDAKDLWHPTTGGAYLATGVGGTIRGFRSDVAIIDDPIKSYEEADSATYREATWTWFNSDLMSRLTPTGKIVLIATPMHEDDLMGRLLRVQKDQWRVLRIPAISEGIDDPIGRPEGEALWGDDHYGYGARLLQIRDAAEREGRSRDWHSQYQGRPRPPEGSMFKPDKFPIIEPAMLPTIDATSQVRSWDLASSAKGDWTVGLKLARVYSSTLATSYFIITDIVRFRGPPEQVRATVMNVAKADGHICKIWLPRDPAQAGADQADSYIRMLTGYRVEAERMSGDKATRADSAASQANIGRISLVRAPWNAAFLEEAASFPRGVHDDQIDALSLAFSKLENDPLAVWRLL